MSAADADGTVVAGGGADAPALAPGLALDHARANGLGPCPAAEAVVERALAEVAGTAGIQSTTQDGCGLAKTPQVNKELYDIPMCDQRLGVVCVAGPTQGTKNDVCHLRLVGFFASEGERAEHVEDLPAGNYMAVDSAVAYTFGDKVFANHADEQAYIRGVLARWAERVREHNGEFDARVRARSSIRNDEEEKQLDAAEDVVLAAQKAARKATAEALARAVKEQPQVTKRERARPLKGAHALHDQSWAVVSLVYDLDQQDLPVKTQWVFTLYGAFASAEVARGHLSDTVQHARPGAMHYVVKMYKWLALDTVLTAQFKRTVPSVCKFEHQQQLWTGARCKKGEVEAHRRQRQQAEDNFQASQAKAALAASKAAPGCPDALSACPDAYRGACAGSAPDRAPCPSVAELLREQALQDDLADRTLAHQPGEARADADSAAGGGDGGGV